MTTHTRDVRCDVPLPPLRLARARRWSCARLDGSTPAARRAELVATLNAARGAPYGDAPFLFLLSAKARAS